MSNEFDLALKVVESSEILELQEMNSLKVIEKELQETFEKSQVFRTRTEMEVSVLNDIKFPTPASKYWQSVREQNGMLNELIELSYEYRKKAVEHKILARDIVTESDALKQEIMKIEMERNLFHLAQMQKVARARIAEIQHWSNIKQREALSMSSEELADVDNHQLISYTKRWLKQANIIGNNGSPAERQNLFGQLLSGYKLCEKRGLLETVLSGFNFRERTGIEENIRKLERQAKE